MISTQASKIPRWFWLIPAINIVLIIWSQSTFDSGDSILHYLHAKQSWHYPKYFLSHWSKPFYVLLSSPFAQFGFVGIKVFNTLCVAVAAWFTFLIASKTSRLGWVILLLLYLAPEYFLSQGSGLTEPLFSTLLLAAIWCYFEEKIVLSLIIASFLPFVRSEGWLIAPVFGLAALLDGKFRSVFWLLGGHLVYAIAGLFYYHDTFWMFHQNPYSGVEEKYGSGDFFHYMIQTPYMIGIPATLLLGIGLIRQLLKFRDILNPLRRNRILLVYISFIVFLVAHSLFWYLGIFHSFGMRRVFIAVIPLMVLIAFDGFTFLIAIIKHQRIKAFALTLICVTIVVFPFTRNKTAFDFKTDFDLDVTQKTILEAANWYQNSEYGDRTVSYGHCYFTEALQKDMDNLNEVVSIDSVKSGNLPVGTIVFWDSFFSVNQKGVSKEILQSDRSYSKQIEFRNPWKNTFFEVAVFEKIR